MINNEDQHKVMNELVEKYQQTKDEWVCTQLYKMVSAKLKSIASRAVIRNPRLDSLEAESAANAGFMDAVRRYKADTEVPFEAFMCLVAGRRVYKRVQAAYTMGANKDVERPVNVDVDVVLDRMEYTPDPGVNDTLDEIKRVDVMLFNVIYLLLAGYTEEEVGRIAGNKVTVDSARSWTRRQRTKAAEIVRKLRDNA